MSVTGTIKHEVTTEETWDGNDEAPCLQYHEVLGLIGAMDEFDFAYVKSMLMAACDRPTMDVYSRYWPLKYNTIPETPTSKHDITWAKANKITSTTVTFDKEKDMWLIQAFKENGDHVKDADLYVNDHTNAKIIAGGLLLR